MEQLGFSFDEITVILPESEDSYPSLSRSHKTHKPSISVREKRKCRTRQYYNKIIAIPAKEEFLSRNISLINGKRIDKTPAFDFFDWYLQSSSLLEKDRIIAAITKIQQERYPQEIIDVIRSLVSEEVYTKWEEHWFDCDTTGNQNDVHISEDLVSPDCSSDDEQRATNFVNVLELVNEGESCVSAHDSERVTQSQPNFDDCVELQDVERIQHIQNCNIDSRVHPDETLKAKITNSCFNVFDENPCLNYYCIGLSPRNCKTSHTRLANVRIFHNGKLSRELYTPRIDIIKSVKIDVYSTLMCDTMAWRGHVPCDRTIIVVNPFKYSRWRWKRWNL